MSPYSKLDFFLPFRIQFFWDVTLSMVYFLRHQGSSSQFDRIRWRHYVTTKRRQPLTRWHSDESQNISVRTLILADRVEKPLVLVGVQRKYLSFLLRITDLASGHWFLEWLSMGMDLIDPRTAIILWSILHPLCKVALYQSCHSNEIQWCSS